MSDYGISLQPAVGFRASKVPSLGGAGLGAAVVVSLALWATIISAALALI